MASESLHGPEGPKTEQPPTPSDHQETDQSAEKREEAGAPKPEPVEPADLRSGSNNVEDGGEDHYATGIGLVLIGLGVAFSVFLVALVSITLGGARNLTDLGVRVHFSSL